MAKTIVIAGDKGGSGKTTTSHAIAHGLAMHGVHAFHISTDPRREILPAEARRYATLDGRDPKALGAILDRLGEMGQGGCPHRRRRGPAGRGPRAVQGGRPYDPAVHAIAD